MTRTSKFVLQLVIVSLVNFSFLSFAMNKSEKALVLNAPMESACFYGDDKLVFSLSNKKAQDDLQDIYMLDIPQNQVASLGYGKGNTRDLISFQKNDCLVRLRMDGKMNVIKPKEKSTQALRLGYYSFISASPDQNKLACLTDHGRYQLFDVKNEFAECSKKFLFKGSQKKETLTTAAIFWQRWKKKQQCGFVYVAESNPTAVTVLSPNGMKRVFYFDAESPIKDIQVSGLNILARHQDEKKDRLSLITKKYKQTKTVSNSHKTRPLLLNNNQIIMGASYDVRTLVLCDSNALDAVNKELPVLGEDIPLAVSPDKNLLVTKNSKQTTLRNFLDK